MKCVISGGNIKILARAIQMLSKIGEEMFVMPQEDCLSFRSVNGHNSAFIDVTFHENYFSYYAYEDLDEADTLKCKILIRSALSVFKAPSLLDRQVESCHIQLEADSNTLRFIVKYKNSIIKTHLLPILDTETIKANYKKDGIANHLCIQPRVMNDVVQNFHQTLVEITIEAQQERALIRNYIDDSSNISNETRTQLIFGVGEFDEYKIESDTTITFCLKELRAILHFAEALAQPIDLYFDRPGRPVVFICKSTTLETNLVLATLNPNIENASQSTASTRPNPAPKKAPTRKAPAKPKGGVKSFTKKALSNTNKLGKTNTNSMSTADYGTTESPGRISDISETPSVSNRRSSLNSSSKTTCTPQAATSNFTLAKAQSEGSLKKIPSSSLLKRKSEQEISSPGSNHSHSNEDLVQNSPPRHKAKKAKVIFQKRVCEKTFQLSSEIVAEDSGESD